MPTNGTQPTLKEKGETFMQPKVSVIIPIYNTEQYLKDCLESVCNQSLEEIQIILIDDGSTDNSAAICKEYVQKYPNKIEYYYKENGGSASARNMGLDHARGEYIGFVDSDDWIEPDMFEKMYNVAVAKDVDIVFCRVFENECPGANEYIFLREGYYNEEELKIEIIPYSLPTVMPKGNFRNIRWSNVLRLYRKNLILENGIRSCEGVSNCEDLGFNMEATLLAKSYYYINQCFYHNRPNPASQSRNYVVHMWNRFRKLITDMHRYIDPQNDIELSQSFSNCIFYFVTMTLRNEMRLPDKKQRISKIQEVVSDPLCLEAVHVISDTGMNKEYATLYAFIKNQDASGIDRYLKQLNFKKKYIAPVLDKLFKNQFLKNLYLKVRGR